jgi:hypothetical protein
VSYLIYRTAPDFQSLVATLWVFGGCLWAFILVSFARAPWKLAVKTQEGFAQLEREHKSVEEAFSEHLDGTTPAIKGEVLVAFSTYGTSLSGRPVHKDTRLVLVVKLVNHRDVPTTIDRYELTLRVGDQTRVVVGRDNFPTPLKIEHQSDYKDSHTKSDEFHTYTSVIPMSARIHYGFPLGRGVAAEGGIIFNIEDTVAGQENTWHEDFYLAVIDSFGNAHLIDAEYTKVISCLIE